MMETFEQHRRLLRRPSRSSSTRPPVDGPAGPQRAACPSPSSSARSSPSAPATRSPPRAARASGPAARRCWATTSTRAAARLLVNADEAAARAGHLRPVPGARGAAAGGAGAGAARLGQQALADPQGPARGGRPVHQDQPAPPADQRGLRRQGALQGRGPRTASSRPSSTPTPSAARAGAAAPQRPRPAAPPVAQPVRRLAQGAAALRAVRLRHDAGALAPRAAAATATTSASRAQKRGWHTCPSKSIPAAEIEQLVVEQIQRRRPRPGAAARGAGRRRAQQDEARAGGAGGRAARPGARPGALAGRAARCCRASCGPARTTARWSPAWPSCRSASRLVERPRAEGARADPGGPRRSCWTRPRRRGAGAVRPGVGDADAARAGAGACGCWSRAWTTTGPRARCRSPSTRRASRRWPTSWPASRRGTAHDDDADDRACRCISRPRPRRPQGAAGGSGAAGAAAGRRAACRACPG